jgi:hypothetical protein
MPLKGGLKTVRSRELAQCKDTLKTAFADTVAGAECPGHNKGIAQKNYSPQQKVNLDEIDLKFR